MSLSFPSFLTGRRVRLRPYEPKDAKLIYQWINNPKVTYYMFYGQKPTNVAQTAEMMRGQVESPTNVVFIIESLHPKKPIGFGGLYDVHPTARKGEFRILIGETTFWNKGLGTEVTEIITFYAFDRLNLNRVWLGVTDENQGAVRAYEKSGYKVEGVLRQEVYRNSQYYNAIRMGLLREEYYPRLAEAHGRWLAKIGPLKKGRR